MSRVAPEPPASSEGSLAPLQQPPRQQLAPIQSPLSSTGSPSHLGAACREMGLLLAATGKVNIENKVGRDLDEGSIPVATALQRGLRGNFAGSSTGDTPVDPSSAVTVVEPAAFQRLRSLLGVTELSFEASVALQQGRESSDMRMVGAGDAAGKSGAFFFFTAGQHYLLKSSTTRDVNALLKILPSYVSHIEAMPTSLLPRYVGVFVLHHAGRTINFLCMTNAFAGRHEVHVRYDLKGSTHGRLASPHERAKARPVFKDLDWTAEARQLVAPDAGLLSSLSADVAFLKRSRLIDYSLLVGVHRKQSGVDYAGRAERSPGLHVVEGEASVEYISIVDMLTPYGLRKRLETFFTGSLMCGRDVSCQPPGQYADRFLAFCRASISAA